MATLMTVIRRPLAGVCTGTMLTAAALFAGCSSGGGDDNEPPEPPVNRAPVADAGADQAVTEAATVELDGSNSADPDGDALTYIWTQVAGLPVTLSDAASANPSFPAPAGMSTSEELGFELVVADGEVESPADGVTIVVEPLPPPAADGFLPTVAAALAAGQFTFNNVWTQADLDYENIDATIGYQAIVNAHPAGRIVKYTTLVQQYEARRRQCEEDYASLYAPDSYTSPLNFTYTFRDRKCYPRQQLANDLDPGTTGDPIASQVLYRYGYYCGAGYPAFNPFSADAPEPLDGVDYCCRLHDASAWANRGDYSNECGITMCLRQASAMPANVLTQFPDIEAARLHWYGEGVVGGASYACPGNQTNAPPDPVFGP